MDTTSAYRGFRTFAYNRAMEAPATILKSSPFVGSAVKRIFLVGFMGAGKSTVGRILAAKLNWRFFDIDRLIEAEQDSSIACLFEAKGEPAFRKLEQDAIHRLHQSERAVISLGGGAVETAEVRQLLVCESGSLVIFLHAPLTLLLQRCLAQEGGSARPVLQQHEQLRSRYDLRLTYYENAHLTVQTETLSPENVAAAIVNRLAALHDANHSSILAEDRD